MKLTFTDVVVSIAMGFMVLGIYASSIENAEAIAESEAKIAEYQANNDRVWDTVEEVTEVIIDASNRQYYHPCESREAYAAYLAQERGFSVANAEVNAATFFESMIVLMVAQYEQAGIKVPAEMLEMLAEGACYISYSDYETSYENL